MEFDHLLRKRKSVRAFSKESIPRKKIEKLIELAVHAPTPCNQQGWKFVIIQERATKEKLIKEAFSSTLIRSAPVVIVVLYDGWNKKEAIQAGSLAIANLLYGAYSMGIGSVCINSYGSESQTRRILGIPKSYEVISFVLLGHEINHGSPPVFRRPVGEVLSFKKYHHLNQDYIRSYDPNDWQLPDLIDYQSYYCRKTTLGKAMDIASSEEILLLKEKLREVDGNTLDLFSYDGMYLEYFSVRKLVTVCLDETTSLYVRKGIESKGIAIGELAMLVYDDIANLFRKQDDLNGINNITMLFKAERLPHFILKNVLKSLGKRYVGEDVTLRIMSRTCNPLFIIFYKALIHAFGNDIRKTGIYSFWGPYRPISIKTLKGILDDSGWRPVKVERYFLFPPFFKEVLQMGLQYFKSGKTSYLHRTRHKNILTTLLDFILRIQGKGTSRIGYVLYVEAKPK